MYTKHRSKIGLNLELSENLPEVPNRWGRESTNFPICLEWRVPLYEKYLIIQQAKWIGGPNKDVGEGVREPLISR